MIWFSGGILHGDSPEVFRELTPFTCPKSSPADPVAVEEMLRLLALAWAENAPPT